LKLSEELIEFEGERYWKKESMKHRFKERWVMFPTSCEDLIWESAITERGLTKKKVREHKAKAKKPYWRKKRKEQRKYALNKRKGGRRHDIR